MPRVNWNAQQHRHQQHRQRLHAEFMKEIRHRRHKALSTICIAWMLGTVGIVLGMVELIDAIALGATQWPAALCVFGITAIWLCSARAKEASNE